MTDAELKEEGISRKVYDEWQMCMNYLWQKCTMVDPVGVKNSGDNSIQWNFQGVGWEIMAKMVNNKYIEISIEKDDKERASFVHDHNIAAISLCIHIIIRGK